MDKTTKQRLVCLSLMVLMIFLFLIVTSCATLTPFLSHQKTFDLTIGIKTFTVMLPKDFPDMKDAIPSGERCWNALICYRQVCVSKEKGHDHIHFWYAPGKKPSAVVWVKENETDSDKKYMCWLYVEGVPFPVDLKGMNDFLQEKLMPPPKTT